MSDYTKAWLKAAGIRALKTVAQAAVAGVGTAAVMGEVDWRYVLSASVLAGVLSILTSVAGLPEVDKDSDYDIVFIPDDSDGDGEV